MSTALAMRSMSLEDEVYVPKDLQPLSPGVDHTRNPLRQRLGERKRSQENGHVFAERMRKISKEYGALRHHGNAFVSWVILGEGG